jgi:hypothetical protein
MRFHCPRCNAVVVQKQSTCSTCGLPLTWMADGGLCVELTSQPSFINYVLLIVVSLIVLIGGMNAMRSYVAAQTSAPVSVVVRTVSPKVDGDIRSEVQKMSHQISLKSVGMNDMGNTVMVTVNLNPNLRTQDEVATITNALITLIEQANNYDVDIRISAQQAIAGTDTVRLFGWGSYYKAGGKIGYEAAPENGHL